MGMTILRIFSLVLGLVIILVTFRSAIRTLVLSRGGFNSVPPIPPTVQM